MYTKVLNETEYYFTKVNRHITIRIILYRYIIKLLDNDNSEAITRKTIFC